MHRTSLTISQPDQRTKRLLRNDPRDNNGEEYRAKRVRHRTRGLLILLVTSALTIMSMLSTLLILHHDYAWVYKRCFVAIIAPTTMRQLACQEAWTHMVASNDPTLFWPLQQKTPPQQQQQQQQATHNYNTGTPVQHVHFTLTAPLLNATTSHLARCSVEAMAKLCSNSNSNSTSPCLLNIWVVDKAATIIASKHSTGNSALLSFLSELVETIQHSNTTKFCIRILPNPTSYNALNVFMFQHNVTLHCPAPTIRSTQAGVRLRTWLGTPNHQIPEHISDAWRLVALLEWGGLYMDLHVLAISPNILTLPLDSVPVQHKVGAYRVNGGVMRLGDSFDTNATTFLYALEEDHLYWAPILARLSPTDQKYGFLGPAALTRVYTTHAYSNEVTVLPEEMIESKIDETLCSRREDNSSLAIHFSGKQRHATWMKIMDTHKCLQTIVRDVCPKTIASILSS